MFLFLVYLNECAVEVYYSVSITSKLIFFLAEMSKRCSKFLLLLWKNWVLQYRKPIQTIFEILSPIVISVVLVVIRSLVDPKEHDGISYPQFCTLPADFNFKEYVCSETEG